MTTVTFTCNLEFFLLSLKVNGHAGYAEAGQDIVCASASLLTFTLAELIAERTREEDHTITLTDGASEITCIARTESEFKRLANYYEYARMGFQFLADQYPDFVTYSEIDTPTAINIHRLAHDTGRKDHI